MCILIFAETWDGKLKKSSNESISFGKHLANQLQIKTKVIIFSNSSENHETLGNYGADEIIKLSSITLERVENDKLANLISEIAKKEEAKHVIISNTNRGKSICSKISYDLNKTLITNAVSLPSSCIPLKIKCKAFSSKAFCTYDVGNDNSVITIVPNSIGYKENKSHYDINEANESMISSSTSIKIVKEEKNNNEVSITDAERVISAGRGLKGPENWKMIEELAGLINGGTACSKPVSDMGWRPHSEHVGQTGIAINPDLYIAVGISGAIQHLAGVSSSKKIVVINTDPEAPFFKSADYGIVGDAFEVIPKLIEEIKKHSE
ncbi:MAG: electron transfer flavoprotein subunit alpha [Flavobacteriales bacterium]|nr:electron transfer flavoprotein subunit alpha [Flavobacteriales bacterium]|tara:strand:- start:14424 stop:15389 length:966 start_codon:yes stop_codon:yes gene_type:complete